MTARPDALRARAKLWFDHGRDDLRVANHLLSLGEELAWIIASHAQQCAEKSLKAVLVVMDIDPPHTHDIEVLREVLDKNGEPTAEIEGAKVLSQFAVTTRYPRIEDEVTLTQARGAVVAAEAVVKWTKRVLVRRGVQFQ